MKSCEEIKDKKIWEDFLLNCTDKTFLQSWNWGEFQERMGHKPWRLGLFDGDKIEGVALASKINAKRGTFILIQHGPVILPGQDVKEALKIFLDKLIKIGKQEKAEFIRMNPLLERSKENRQLFRELGFRQSPMHANAYESTWKLDITPSEEELMSGMRKTTRYLIRQTQKNSGIEIEKSNDASRVADYQKLNEEVAGRQKFVPFSENYVKNEFGVFSNDGEALFMFGKYEGEIAAASLVIFWSGVGFYHQAASSSRFQKLSVPYLLQWEAIKEAKSRGCSTYDFWGFVDPKKEPKHPWAGPTLFKMGFGGKSYEYLKTQDYPLSKKYWLVNVFERMRRIKRGL